MPVTEKSAILTIRVPLDLDRRIAQAARRRKATKSAILREALDMSFGAAPRPPDPAREARRQSLLVSGRASERDALDFVHHAADKRGWR
jgi:hypothetical protein